MKKRIGVVVLIIFSVILVVVSCIGASAYCNRREAENVIARIEQGYSARDLSVIIDSFPPEIANQVNNSFLNQTADGTEEALWELLEDTYGKDFRATFEIIKKHRLTDAEVKERIGEINDTWGVTLNPGQLYCFTVNETFVGAKKAQTEEEFLVGEMKDNWYIFDVR